LPVGTDVIGSDTGAGDADVGGLACVEDAGDGEGDAALLCLPFGFDVPLGSAWCPLFVLNASAAPVAESCTSCDAGVPVTINVMERYAPSARTMAIAIIAVSFCFEILRRARLA
jgi:hypothetical protein